MNSLRFTTLKQHFSAPPVHSSAHAPPPRTILFYAKALRCWLFVLALPRLRLLLLLLTLLGINLFVSLSVIGVIESSGNGFSSFTCIYSLIIGLGLPSGGVKNYMRALQRECDSQKKECGVSSERIRMDGLNIAFFSRFLCGELLKIILVIIKHAINIIHIVQRKAMYVLFVVHTPL